MSSEIPPGYLPEEHAGHRFDVRGYATSRTATCSCGWEATMRQPPGTLPNTRIELWSVLSTGTQNDARTA